MPEIKPCPFCGFDAVLITGEYEVFGVPHNKYGIACNWCGATVTFSSNTDSEERTIKTWNKRTQL